MLLIIETPHRGPIRMWKTRDKESFVVALLEKYPRADDLHPDISFEDAVAWLRSDLRALGIHDAETWITR